MDENGGRARSLQWILWLTTERNANVDVFTQTHTHTHSKMSTRHLDVPISCYSTSYRVEFTASLKVQSCSADYEMSPELLDKVVRGERGDISILARASLKASYTNTPTACWHRQSSTFGSTWFQTGRKREIRRHLPASLFSLESSLFFFHSRPEKRWGEKLSVTPP